MNNMNKSFQSAGMPGGAYGMPYQNYGNYSPGSMNPYQTGPIGQMGALNQMNQFAPPNLNYSTGQQYLNQSMGPIQPGMNFPYQGIPNQYGYGNSFIDPRNVLSNYPYQNTQNLANVQGGNLHQLNEYLLERDLEKEEMQKQTQLIKKGLEDEEDAPESREERNKKRLMRFRQGAYFKPPIEIYVPRSEYFYERDRYFLEQLIMKPLKTNGALGTRLVRDFDKRALLLDDPNYQGNMFAPADAKYVDDENEYFEKAVKDGIYLDYIKQLIYSYNIQKIEQRAAREGKKDWFRPNGDLRMDNDIFSDVITKPTDITLNQNERFNIFYGNSSFSGRNSDTKLRVFKLKLIVSKVIFTYHPVFTQEEVLASEVKQLHKEFYSHMNQLNIPYYKEKISTIQHKMEEYSKLKNQSDSIKIEMKNMKIFLNETNEFLLKEKEILNAKANELYSKWCDLKQLRAVQQYQSTSIKLNVIRFPCDETNPNIYDYAFILTNNDITQDVTIVPKDEQNRREKVKTYQCFLKFFINGVFAFETTPSNFNWPSFEVDFGQQFILNMYTRPAKMEIELYINKVLIERFEAEPPGIFAKTLTSTSPLLEQIEFGIVKKKEEKKLVVADLPGKELNKNEENEGLLDEQKKEDKEEEKKLEEKHTKVEGIILLKTEWEGRSSELPPTKIEDKLELNSKQLQFKEEIRKYNAFDYPFDVNDPRNVAFIEEMKKGRLELMLKFLYREYLLDYYDVKSTRHYLLLKRMEKKSMSDYTFPILEAQIEDDPAIQETLKGLLKEDTHKVVNKDDEYDRRIKEGLDKLQKEYSGRILNEDEFNELLKKKINVMKKDIVHYQVQSSYFQIISEAELYDDPILIFKEFFRRVFSRARKLAPLRIKPAPVKVEKTESLKINIHVVKGYNIPVRANAQPTKVVDQQKLELVGLKVRTMRNVMIENANRFSNRSGEINQGMSGPYGGIGAPGVGMNNTNPFQNNSINQSFNVEIMNRSGTMGNNPNNPNLANAMFNPADPGMMPMYRQPGLNGAQVNTIEEVQRLANLELKISSFIEVKIVYYDQEGVFRTDAVDSIHPDYNHQIEFTIKPKDGKKYFTREELAKCPGVFYFTLYDEVRREEVKKGKADSTYIQKFEKKYLGSFTIPFATVFQNASILDTICKVDIPKTVFGYYSDTSSTFDITQNYNKEEKKPDDSTQQIKNPGGLNVVPKFDGYGDTGNLDDIPRIINPFINTYVSLYITLDPVPNFTKNEDLDYVPGFEDSIFLINATKWAKTMKEKSLLKDRNIRLFAENFDGFSVFMPRYLRPEGQRPHELLFNVNDPNAIEKVSRYVALIPFIEDSQTWDFAEDIPDCWCTDDQFLTLGFGDYEEHAVLLCNYFNYVDQKQGTGCVSYLALGDAHPEGLTIYVMRISESKKEVEFWNAKTGECFFFDKTIEENKFLCLTVSKSFRYTKSNSDKICQLKSVGSIVTFDNVYVNIQKESDPGLIDFDLSVKANWTPFLTEEGMKKYFPKGVKTVQKDLIYTEPSEEKALELKIGIKDYLKRAIEKTRSEMKNNEVPLRTNWETTANDKIERILQQYEMFCFNSSRSVLSHYNNLKKNAGAEGLLNLKEQKKIDQESLMTSLIDFEKQIKDEFIGVQEIYGFPINLSYTTMKEIWEQIKLTDVHLIGTENSELSLTVYVNPLPSNVNSVWIFFAILKKDSY